MADEILVNCSPLEIRMALIENGVVQELSFERVAHRGLVGGIYKGRVVRVLPGMQAAFVDIGLERSAFIHIHDIEYIQHQASPQALSIASSGQVAMDHTHTPLIQDVLTEGQSLVVQVVKDQIGSKGARLTTALSLPSHYLVFMPHNQHIGLSQRIENPLERDRLKSLLESLVTQTTASGQSGGGVIARTIAEGMDREVLGSDLTFLKKMWSSIEKKIIYSQPVSVLHQDLPLYLRILRDLMRPPVQRVLVDSETHYRAMLDFAKEFMPGFEQAIELYVGERPIFDLHNTEDEIKKALGRKVQLKSGGYLVFDQTEAMTTIDVNTGAYVGHRNLEETIFKTNLEAAHAIARQLRLRNLGGIIIIDFIDMEDEEHKRQVMRTFEKFIERDRAKTKITQVSELGLVEMTRKRTHESLSRLLCEPCPTCYGRGVTKTAETLCCEIFREIIREANIYNASEYRVIASQSVVDRLLDEESSNVAELEAKIGKTIQFQVEALYGPEQYDVILL